MNRTVWEMFELGGPVMWPLLATSVLGLGIILDRLVAFYQSSQRSDRVAAALRPLVRSGDWQQAQQWCQGSGPLSRVARVYLEHRNAPQAVREDLVRREGLLALAHLDKGLRWLAVLAQISTLLGLLGTFHVMIVRFSQGEMSGKPIDPAHFSSAVWEGLLTTMYGLVIAIPCSAVYQILESRVDAMARQIDILVSYLDQWNREAAQLGLAAAECEGETAAGDSMLVG